MSVRFLFWNLNQNHFGDLLRAAVDLHEIDVLVLTESPWEGSELLTLLNRDSEQGLPVFQLPFSECRRIQLVSRFSPRFVPAICENRYLSIRQFALPGRQEVLFAALHMPSKLHSSRDSQALEAAKIAGILRDTEAKQGHQRMIVTGDFNLNPFENGMVGASSFHAVRTRDVADRISRKVNDEVYPFFYNPMWKFFADREDSPPGTYYYEKSEQITHFWHVYDQLLLRPELARGFRQHQVSVLSEIGGVPLRDTNGRPEKRVASDHLPLYFQLQF